MWPFSDQPKTKTVLAPIRPCSCGERSYGQLRAVDTVHCNYCGAMYLIHGVEGPVAKYETLQDDKS